MGFKGIPKITTSVKISPEFYELAKNNFLKLSDCLAMGISLALAEKGVKEYDNNLNLMRKLEVTRKELERVSNKLYQDNNIAEKEAKNEEN